MKKIIICILLILLVTGCDVEYNLEFKNGNFNEEIVFTMENNNDNKKIVDDMTNTKYYAIFDDNIEKEYDKKIIEKKDSLQVKLFTNYLIDQYRKSILFNKCYPLFGLQSDDEYYYISTVGEFKCMVYDYSEVDNVKIKFSTNYEVVDNNADYIEDNYYIWTINSTNSSDKPINIVLDKNNIVEEEQEKINTNLILAIIGGSILLLVLIIKLIGARKNKI